MAIRPSVKKQGSRLAVSVAEREQITGGEFLYNLSPLQEQHPSLCLISLLAPSEISII